MPYVLPDFNLECNIWHYTTYYGAIVPFAGVSIPSPIVFGTPDVADVPCNLAWGRRVSSMQGLNAHNQATLLMALLLPPGADIRSAVAVGQGGGPDVVEVPGGSGRIYLAIDVDDLGKGFANEHRGAALLAWGSNTPMQLGDGNTYYGVQWPAPIP